MSPKKKEHRGTPNAGAVHSRTRTQPKACIECGCKTDGVSFCDDCLQAQSESTEPVREDAWSAFCLDWQ